MFTEVLPPYRVPPTIQREIDQGKYAGDQRLSGNRFLELKALRPSQRTWAIKHKLISDPEHRTDLTGAITVVGTCMDMCPEFERHEREFQKDVDEWEKIPDTNPKRIDHVRAVKKYRRSAAGNDDPLPSDLRPPAVLKKTLDYLLHTLLPTYGLAATYAFIRDRTRSIRTDFVIQHVKDAVAIECFERIARFHILAVHVFCSPEERPGETDEPIKGFDYWLEVEQMLKTLQSLMQFYDDRPHSAPPSPNEAEFRAYYLLAHLRSTTTLRRLHSLPVHIFNSPILQAALEFHSYAQAMSFENASTTTHKSRAKSATSSLPLQNFFSRFFKRVHNPATSYLMACLLELNFGAVRGSAIHALWKAYSTRHRGVPIGEVGVLLGMGVSADHVDEGAVADVVRTFGMIVEEDDGDGVGKRVLLSRLSRYNYSGRMSQRHSVKLVEVKRGGLHDVDIVDGRFNKVQETWAGERQGIGALKAQDRALPSAPVSAVRSPVAKAPFFNSNATWPALPSENAPWPSFHTQTTAAATPALSAFTQPPPTPMSMPVASSSTAQKAFSFPVSTAAPHPAASLFGGPLSALSTEANLTSPSRSPVSFSPLQSQPSVMEAILPVQTSSLPLSVPLSVHQLWQEKAEKDQKEVQTRKEEEQRKLQEQREREKVEELCLQKRLLQRRQEQARQRRKEEEQKQREEEEALERDRRRQLRLLRQESADLRYISNIFRRWKRVVVWRGQSREQFRSSIRGMGLSSGGGEATARPQPSRKGKEKAWSVEEDVISWEDMSQASVLVSRKRSRRHMRRADDEATLAAIREAETTRLKLWERGTFAHAVKKRGCVGDIWLCSTAENVSTSEWLHTKFGVDRVEDDFLHKIPVSPTGGRGPGLIVLDLSAADDESANESDLSRIQQCISNLPSDHYYIPSLLLLQWTGPMAPRITSELARLKEENFINSWHALTFVNDGTHFDDQFCEILEKISFDTVGKVVEKWKLGDLYRSFYDIWELSLSDWISNCQAEPGGAFEWILYGEVLSVMVGLLNHLAREVLQLFKINNTSKQLPLLDGSTINSKQSAFETIINYLTKEWLLSDQSALLLRAEIAADMNHGREFLVRAIPERIAQLMLYQLRSMVIHKATFLLDTQRNAIRVAAFASLVHSSLSHLDRLIQKPSISAKKRSACDDASRLATSNGFPDKRVKRVKQDIPSDEPQPQPGVNGIHTKQDVLSRLKMSVAKARQSVDDLRSMRGSTEQSMSVADDGSESWDLIPGGADSPQRMVSRTSPWTSRYRWNEPPPALFNPKEDILPLIPRSELEVIPARSVDDLYTTNHRSRFASPTKAHASKSYPPLTNGYSNDFAAGLENSSSVWHLPSESNTSNGTRWSRLKGSVERAKKAVEQSRWEREARSSGRS